MSSTKKGDAKENTNRTKESTERYLEQQRQQYKDTTSDLTQATEKINENVNKFQDNNRRIIEKSADTFGKFQEQINKTTQEISYNIIDLQKNVFNIYQSSYSQFLNNISKSYWQNFMIPERYSETYNTLNKNIQDSTVKTTNFLNEIFVGSIENLKKSLELTQRYYSDIVQNNFNYIQKLERSYNR